MFLAASASTRRGPTPRTYITGVSRPGTFWMLIDRARRTNGGRCWRKMFRSVRLICRWRRTRGRGGASPGIARKQNVGLLANLFTMGDLPSRAVAQQVAHRLQFEYQNMVHAIAIEHLEGVDQVHGCHVVLKNAVVFEGIEP